VSDIAKVSGKNFTLAQLGDLENLDQYGERMKGKLFLKDILNLTGMEVSMNKLPAGKQIPFYHKHKNDEELYIFIKGQGQFQIDGETLDVREGTVIRVAPEGSRIWRNNSNEDLYFIVIQAAQNSLNAWTATDGIIEEKPITWPE
jgi:mannose-6-phosphate isomerase-like protein (cupin superfamily)